MSSLSTKTLLFLAWPIAVVIAAVAIDVASVSSWLLVACVAIVPPAVVQRFWHAPEQTISESISEARR